MSPLVLSLVVLALTSPLLWVIRPHRFRHIGWLAAVPPTLIAGWLFSQMPLVAAGQIVTTSVPWAPQFGLDFALRLDGLSLLFGLIITVIGAGVAIYTGYYFEDEPRLGFFYGLLFLFMASMLGLVWADNILLLFVFWEGTSMTSYLLIAFKDTDKSAQDGARRAFLITGVGGLALLLGGVLLGTSAGTFTISEMVARGNLSALPLSTVALALILVAAFTKSAQFPLHFWLPGAMAAPTPASAYLHSATMVKAGVYLLARLHPGLADHPLWFWALLLFGGTTMVVGAVFAIGQYDLKGLLAYATVSQLGVFVALLAFDSNAAIAATVVGILAHALYKGPLFLLAGIIDHATGTRDLRKLAGLRVEMPLVALAGILSALSMAGVPPFLGFVAKELLLEAFKHSAEHGEPLIGWIGFGVTAVTAVFTVAAGLILLWEPFLRSRRTVVDAAHVHHVPTFGFVFAPLALMLMGTAIPFVLPQLESQLFAPSINTIAAAVVDYHIYLWHGFNFVFLTSAGALTVGALLFWQRAPIRALLNRWPESVAGTKFWDKFVYGMYDIAGWVTRTIQGGSLAQQVSVILGAAVVVLGFAITNLDGIGDLQLNLATMPSLAELILATLAMAAAIITVRADTRLGAIISLGVVGIVVTLIFGLYGAPDLALTQLLVDILTVVLLVLVFFRIPPDPAEPLPRSAVIRNNAMAVLMGIFGFGLVLFAVGSPIHASISDYFSLNAVSLGHGANIVNVILVDFRGFDTLGEITVLGIAALGGYAALRAGLFRARVNPSIPGENVESAEKE
jgi:multicomponent Na+:H+ antiporter subunit A